MPRLNPIIDKITTFDKKEISIIKKHTATKAITAKVTEDDFFKKGSAGGTFVSTGINKCLEVVSKRYHQNSWNIYAFHCSDGDNWPEDNQRAIDLSSTLQNICQLYCFIQVTPERDTEDGFWHKGGMADVYLPIADSKFKIVHIGGKDDIWPQFTKIFGGKV